MGAGVRGGYRGTPIRTTSLPRIPKMLARAESAVSQTTITAVTDLTGLSIDFAVTIYKVRVRLVVPIVYGSTAASVSQLSLTDEANTEKSIATMAAGEVNGGGIMIVEEEITAPGVYSRKGRISLNSGGGNTNTLLSSTILAFIEAQEFED